ncbi:uncharacterized protein [Nicotiana tomentosiformis]|uniref:uncharacterized protein n=1 Tax=Nicotiana tomentosiformis TaxID=4098 RepID=UPI00388C3742
MESFVNLIMIDKCMRYLKFQHYISNIYGKVLLMWSGNNQISVVSVDDQQITIKMQNVVNKCNVFITYVYAKCTTNERKDLWSGFEGTHMLIDGPWCIGGDFNVILDPDEKNEVEFPTNFSKLRPISLSNFTSKIISKFLSRRLNPILHKLILENQSGFVKERSITEKILLAQEITQNINHRNCDSNIIIKIDMEKAYDRMSWKFLIFVMRKFGFSEEWIDIIWDLVNEVCMDNRGPNINHLAYADDIVTFCGGNNHSIKLIKKYIMSWKNLLKTRSKAEMHISWKIQNGSSSFWWDNWTGKGPLAYMSQGTRKSTKTQVNSFIYNGQWDINRLNQVLPSHIPDFIMNIDIGNCLEEDFPVWSISDDGQFSIKSSWHLIRLKK